MTVPMITFEDMDERLDWLDLVAALEAGHERPQAEIGDTFLYRGKDTLLSRSAWIDGFGVLVKTATLFPENSKRNLPTAQGVATILSDDTGALEALIDFRLLTKWKTAGDSLLGATRLARPDSKTILIVGAGAVSSSLREAYGAAFPDAEFLIWNRNSDKAAALADAHERTRVVTDLETGIGAADIVASGTIATEPLIKGDWLQPGQHVDLIGAFRPDMREADDAAMRRARIFVDSRNTTVGHIGEIMIPLASGVITEADIVADFYDIKAGTFARQSDDDITLFKNGGGAHLDLMTARNILDSWQSAA